MRETHSIHYNLRTQENAMNSNPRAERTRLNQLRFSAYPAGQSFDGHLSTEAVRHE